MARVLHVAPELSPAATRRRWGWFRLDLDPLEIVRALDHDFCPSGKRRRRAPLRKGLATLPFRVRGVLTFLYRSMKEDPDGLPAIGPTARSLGVRPATDIPLMTSGWLSRATGACPSARTQLKNLPEHRRPPGHGGTGPDQAWELDENDLLPELAFVWDENDPEKHGFVEPAWLRKKRQVLRARAVTSKM
jgi:hypothetical protein